MWTRKRGASSLKTDWLNLKGIRLLLLSMQLVLTMIFGSRLMNRMLKGRPTRNVNRLPAAQKVDWRHKRKVNRSPRKVSAAIGGLSKWSLWMNRAHSLIVIPSYPLKPHPLRKFHRVVLPSNCALSVRIWRRTSVCDVVAASVRSHATAFIETRNV